MARALMNKDLKLSGLSPLDGRKAGCVPKTRSETKELTGEYRYSYTFPYPDIAGNDTDFYRVKFTSDPRKPFSVITKKPPKYAQPKGTLPHIYFPPGFDFERLADDVNETIIIPEGEKKTLKGLKERLTCIGISGAWAWRSKKKGVPAIKDLDLIKWKGRKVILCFDNDLMTNPLVIGALAMLSKELHRRGAKVFIKFLPKGPGKIGLDDYLLKRDAKAFMKLREEEYSASAKLWELNGRIAFIENVNGIWDRKTRMMYPHKQALLFQFASNTYQELKADGEGFKTVSSAEAWTKWPYGSRYEDIGFFPGKESVVDNSINTWTGWGVEANKGDVRPVLDLIDYLFGDCPEHKTWFLQWLAYPIQYPGTKLFSSVLIWSREQGVGKSLLAEIMRDVYGSNGAEIEREHLGADFNDWVANKQFIQGDEITGSDSRAKNFGDKLKAMITRESVRINRKYEKPYTLRDCANYFFTSNHVDALFLEDQDRRYFVVEVSKPKKSDVFYARLRKWRDKPDTDNPNGKRRGASALRWYLENEVDLTGFSPYAPPPMTDDKQRMIDLSKSDLDIWAAHVLKNPDVVFRMVDTIIERELFTAAELISFAPKPGGRDASSIAISKALHRVRIYSRELYTHKGSKKLFPARNPQAWAKRDNREWAAHYKTYYGEGQKEKFK